MHFPKSIASKECKKCFNFEPKSHLRTFFTIWKVRLINYPVSCRRVFVSLRRRFSSLLNVNWILIIFYLLPIISNRYLTVRNFIFRGNFSLFYEPSSAVAAVIRWNQSKVTIKAETSWSAAVNRSKNRISGPVAPSLVLPASPENFN